MAGPAGELLANIFAIEAVGPFRIRRLLGEGAADIALAVYEWRKDIMAGGA
jgi:hypothetical protein